MRKRILFGLFIFAALIIGGLLVAKQYVDKREHAYLHNVLGVAAGEIEIVSKAVEPGILSGNFGRRDRAWHIRFRRNSVSLRNEIELADASDLAFAVSCIEDLLDTSLKHLKSPSVYRRDVGRHGAYLVRDGMANDVYIYLNFN